MTVRVFISDDLYDSYPDAQNLINDFKAWKSGLCVPDYFGRDGDYHDNEACRSAEVWHLHLSESTPPGLWTSRLSKIFSPPSKNPYYRTSEKHLVYCRGFIDRDAYLLIDLLEPDAHRLARNTDVMLRIARAAEQFRNTY